jgi:hypothetical protein
LQGRSEFSQLDFASRGASFESEPCGKETYLFIQIITLQYAYSANTLMFAMKHNDG